MNLIKISVRSVQKTFAAIAIFALVFSPFANIVPVHTIFAAGATINQGENGKLSSPKSPVTWTSGNVGQSKGHFAEGESIPYRLALTGLVPNAVNTVVIGFDVIKANGQNKKFAIDYITTDKRISETVSPCDGTGICADNDLTPDDTFVIPSPAYIGSINGYGAADVAQSFQNLINAEGDQVVKIWNGDITNVEYTTNPDLATDEEARVTITFVSSTTDAVISWGGHISESLDYPGESAVNIPGSPYHTRLIDLNGSGGNQDLPLSADAIIYPGNLIVIKHVVNTGGGTKSAGDFTINVTADNTVNPTQFQGSEDGIGVTITVPKNGTTTYSVTEVTHPDYKVDYSDGCTGGVVSLQQNVCTITNTYIPPVLPKLTLVKNVVNEGGGSAQAEAWTLVADGATTDLSGTTGVNGSVEPGSYNLSETGGPTRYTAGDWECTGKTVTNSQVTLEYGDDVTCTITNTYVPPDKASITVFKTVTNDNGGTASTSTFQYFVNGVTEVFHNVAAMFEIFSPTQFNLSESNTAGYQAGTWGGNCNPDGTVTLDEGQSATCTITNDDIAPSITVIKKVENGTSPTPKLASDFNLQLDATNINGSGHSSVGFKGDENGANLWFNAGEYEVTEPSHDGYAVKFEGDCKGTAALDQDLTCTVTNTYIEPTVTTVTFVKEVINNNGGTAVPDNFSFDINGETVANGGSIQLPIGTYTISENGPSGYEASYSTTCQGGSITIEQIDLGEAYTCTVTNDDIAPQLTVIKEVVNDNKYAPGTATSSDFTITVDGDNVSNASFQGSIDGVTLTLDAGDYLVDEPNPGNYNPSFGADCDGTIALGEHKTCVITNNDISESEANLSVTKVLKNIFGGLKKVTDFSFLVNGSGATAFEADGTNDLVLTTAGAYTITEVPVQGYEVGYSNGCSFDAELGASYACTITNTQLPQCRDGIDNDNDGIIDFAGGDPGCEDGDDNNESEMGAILLNKVVTGEGASETQAFTFDPEWTNATGSDVVISAQSSTTGWTNLAPGQYTFTELDNIPRWDFVGIECTDGSGVETVFVNGNSVQVNIGPDEVVTCTVTNNYTPRDSGGNNENIVIKKEVTDGSDTRTGFSFDPSWGDIFNLTAGTSYDSGDLDADEVYSISEIDLPIGWTLSDVSCSSSQSSERQIDPSEFVLNDGETITCVFLNDQERFIIEGYVWEDTDKDGVFDEGENPLSGWTVRATDGSDTQTTTSADNGYYQFNVPRGTWTISETLQSGWDQTFPTTDNEGVHVVTVPAEEPEENIFTMLIGAVLPTAHAALVGSYGDYNFGNVKQPSSRSTGTRIRRSSGGSSATPTPQVLGEQVSVVPVGAADAGAGGTQPQLPTLQLTAVAFLARRQNHG